MKHQVSMEGSKKVMKRHMEEVYGSDAVEGNFDFVAELEKLTAEHIEAEGNLAEVKVKVPDWFKLDEKWMMDD
ncbi:hypothetical protein Bca52824_017637 [Brassica carinata]|uniref:Uncharacterized protein n=1 Tax=Brassica carinata TaxID=52824 RepID=A0A8X8AWI6_BRACI|nr:hypothetical protein Bca52824_017637 [Brassica carinata]